MSSRFDSQQRYMITLNYKADNSYQSHNEQPHSSRSRIEEDFCRGAV